LRILDFQLAADLEEFFVTNFANAGIHVMQRAVKAESVTAG
jgi:hypothetical protein